MVPQAWGSSTYPAIDRPCPHTPVCRPYCSEWENPVLLDSSWGSGEALMLPSGAFMDFPVVPNLRHQVSCGGSLESTDTCDVSDSTPSADQVVVKTDPDACIVPRGPMFDVKFEPLHLKMESPDACNRLLCSFRQSTGAEQKCMLVCATVCVGFKEQLVWKWSVMGSQCRCCRLVGSVRSLGSVRKAVSVV